MSSLSGSTGLQQFVKKHGLWNSQQTELGDCILSEAERLNLESVRISFADQHGILRGKTITVSELASVFSAGCSMTSTLLLKDTSNRTVFPIWSSGAGLKEDHFTGAGDMIMVPDPNTFKVLPWAEKTGWLLSDVYFPNGEQIPFSSRGLCSKALNLLSEAGFDYLSGIEIEFHLFRLKDPNLGFEELGMPGTPPDVAPLAHGFQYLSEIRLDELEPVVDLIRKNILEMDLPLRTVEAEFGPSQVEFTFSPLPGLNSADLMILFRAAAKQICRRHGYHASFMCRPGLKNVFASGWHLHQSLLDRKTDKNAFSPEDGECVISEVGQRFVAGLLENASSSCIFTTPTINGYKRYKPESLAPDRILWARDNRGAMIRVLGREYDENSRIENRVGEPGANPYFYLMSQILSGLDGIKRDLDAPPLADTPYCAEAPALPQNIMEAVQELDSSEMYRRVLGDEFIDYLLTIKRHEIKRFMSEVTDWEHKEYFEIL
ncbi:MAG: glutamine synthetase [Rhodospirillaceae bacterium]|nr:glutamine synthetase [Rhodospirillaceae bacterium]